MENSAVSRASVTRPNTRTSTRSLAPPASPYCMDLSLGERAVIPEGTFSSEGQTYVTGGIEMNRRVSWVTVLVFLLLALPGCALPSDPNSGVGVQIDNSGLVSVIYLPCANDSIRWITVEDARGAEIWHAERAGKASASVNEIELGKVPMGWRGTSTAPSFTGTVYLELRTIQRNPGRLAVHLDRLREGVILSDDGAMSREQFVNTRNYCSS